MIQKSTVLLYVPEMMEMPAGRTTGNDSVLVPERPLLWLCLGKATPADGLLFRRWRGGHVCCAGGLCYLPQAHCVPAEEVMRDVYCAGTVTLR